MLSLLVCIVQLGNEAVIVCASGQPDLVLDRLGDGPLKTSVKDHLNHVH